MLDIEKLGRAILKIISEPINSLASRIKLLEKTNEKIEPLVLDLMKYTGLLENFSSRMEEVASLKISGLDPSQLYTADQLKTLVNELVEKSREEVEKKIPSEDAIVEKTSDLIVSSVNSILEKLFAELPKPEAIDYDKLKAPELPDISAMIQEEVSKHAEEIKHGLVTVDDAKSMIKEIAEEILPEAPLLPDIPSMVADFVKAAVAELPKPEPGKSVTLDDVKPIIEAMVGKVVAEIPQPTLPDFSEEIAEEVAKALMEEVKNLPKPEPGKSVTVDDVKPILQELVNKAVATIPVPKDGVGAASAIIDREGNLIITMTDGKTVELGPVVGRDVDMAVVEKLIHEKVAAIPKPKDGEDGIGFDDLSMEYDNRRTFTFKFLKGDKIKSYTFKVPNMIYCDVYDTAKSDYEIGDTVTWGGSLWHCNKDGTRVQPGQSKDWTLAAKRGRDGNEVVKLPPSNKPVKKS